MTGARMIPLALVAFVVQSDVRQDAWSRRLAAVQAPAPRPEISAPAASAVLALSRIGPVAQGGVALVTITAPAEVTALTLTAFGDADVPVWRAGGSTWEALLGVDLERPAGRHPLVATALRAGAQPLTAQVSFIVTARQFATRRLRVGSQFVDPSPAELDRIRDEAARLDAIYQSRTERRWQAPFVPPVRGAATSNFGTRSVFNGQPRAPHAGIDFRGAVGTRVVAPAAGRVALAEDLFFTGNTVIVDHGAGLLSLFAHLSRIDVQPGLEVTASTPIGLVGATGRVTGPHLHWAVRLAGARVDPGRVLQLLGRR